MLPLLRLSVVSFVVFLAGCQPARRTLRVHALPNYDPSAAHRLLFLDFAVNRSAPGQPERLLLTNAIVGNGKMKNLGSPGHSPSQIKLIRYYTDNRPPERDSLDHPLIRSVEIADTDGSLTRRLTSDLSGHFSVRFPHADALSRIDFYSVTPDNGPRKVHSLRLKP